jgi:hypothetical protein
VGRKDDFLGRSNDNSKKTDKAVDAFAARFETWIGRAIRRVLSKTDFEDFRESAAALTSMMESLKRAGLNDRIAEIEDLYGEELVTLKDKFADLASAKEIQTAVDFDTAEQLVQFRARKAVTDVEQYVGSFSVRVLDQVVIGGGVDLDAISETLDSRLVSNIRTELRTELAVFQRTITKQVGDELGVELYAYVGPTDKIIRDFCKSRVGKVFSVEEIKAMDNGQGLDVFTSGGGYNCRHDWRPVTQEIAAEVFGYKP